MSKLLFLYWDARLSETGKLRFWALFWVFVLFSHKLFLDHVHPYFNRWWSVVKTRKTPEQCSCTALCTMLHVHWVILIIVPCFSCPFYTRSLYINGSSSSCLWSSSEIEIRNRIVDKLSEFTSFNEKNCTSGQRLTTPWSKSETTSLVNIVSIRWRLLFSVEWN